MRGLYAPDPLRSRPVRIHWAGWETDTYRLQKAGWDLSAEENLYERTMQIAMRYRDEIRGITERVEADPYRLADRHAPLHLTARMASNFQIMMGIPGDAFQAIDARPQWRSPEPPNTFDDFAHFARVEAQPRIIIPEESVPKLLERILELQQPARAERIQQEIREDAEVRPLKFHGNIVSFAA